MTSTEERDHRQDEDRQELHKRSHLCKLIKTKPLSSVLLKVKDLIKMRQKTLHSHVCWEGSSLWEKGSQIPNSKFTGKTSSSWQYFKCSPIQNSVLYFLLKNLSSLYVLPSIYDTLQTGSNLYLQPNLLPFSPDILEFVDTLKHLLIENNINLSICMYLVQTVPLMEQSFPISSVYFCKIIMANFQICFRPSQAKHIVCLLADIFLTQLQHTFRNVHKSRALMTFRVITYMYSTSRPRNIKTPTRQKPPSCSPLTPFFFKVTDS